VLDRSTRRLGVCAGGIISHAAYVVCDRDHNTLFRVPVLAVCIEHPCDTANDRRARVGSPKRSFGQGAGVEPSPLAASPGRRAATSAAGSYGHCQALPNSWRRR
jgi:hypothetical protein